MIRNVSIDFVTFINPGNFLEFLFFQLYQFVLDRKVELFFCISAAWILETFLFWQAIIHWIHILIPCQNKKIRIF